MQSKEWNKGTDNEPTCKAKVKTTDALPVLNPNAAGADIASTEIYVAVPKDRAAQPVRAFATTAALAQHITTDLLALADWLQECGIQTIAMESTGLYWIPLFQILEARGIQVCLVNSRHVKNVPGRTSDVSDCQWLQYLHLPQAGTRRPLACLVPTAPAGLCPALAASSPR